MNAIVPISKCAMAVRPAEMSDVGFLDQLQKMHGKALGYFPTKQFEEYVQSGGVLIAEEGATPVGYCISRDRYLKRDELGVIFQLCVAGGSQRKLVGASLVREAFARSAYGCKLYCCWCAQDLEANHFWESLGFVPLAFRAGSRGKDRVHIFWQRRIREGDATTPYWFPAQTSSGAIREDRLVLPIPPGTSWKDVMPRVLPGGAKEKKMLESEPSNSPKPQPMPQMPKRRYARFGPPPSDLSVVAPPVAVPVHVGKPKREKKPKAKNDPQHVAAARELRDRYLEQFNSGRVLPAGRYDVAVALPSSRQVVKALPLAA